MSIFWLALLPLLREKVLVVQLRLIVVYGLHWWDLRGFRLVFVRRFNDGEQPFEDW